MVGKPDMIVLVLLRRIDDQMTEARLDLAEIKDRLGLNESHLALSSRRLDRIGADINRIKSKLDVSEGEH
jgi:hypothetical protein